LFLRSEAWSSMFANIAIVKKSPLFMTNNYKHGSAMSMTEGEATAPAIAINNASLDMVVTVVANDS
jgi:hypothetical protein